MRHLDSSLTEVIALARAGALDEAWAQFRAGGFDRDDRPPALTLKGRLLKDRAAQASGEDRRALFREAADAYAMAAERDRATYPLVNAATLSLLSRDSEAARRYAAEVLRRIDEEPDEPETPYYRCATRAEALLLLDRDEEARAAFAEAIGLAPRAWEDHATTLRQFGLILAEQEKDASWLDPCRPPCSCHFAGHMAFDPASERGLGAAIAEALVGENIGFGFGALAAGADIIIAEALLARGGELHLILPGGAEAFAAHSVDPFGAAWRARFDAVLEKAETVRPIRPLGLAPDAAMIALADEVAMGAAIAHARRLESRPVQILVVDPGAPSGQDDGATARAQARWARSGRGQRLIRASRDTVPPALAAGLPGSQRRALAMLSIRFAEAPEAPGLEARLGALRERTAGLPSPAIPPHWTGDQLLLGYQGLADAATAGLELAAAGFRVGGHYLVAEPFSDPFSGAERVPAVATAAAAAAAASTPAGSVCVTDDFAAALAVAGEEGPLAEYVGELDPPDGGPPVGLYALKPRLR